MNHDYSELGFKSGLEIHQQLEGTKLFCQCPTTIKKEDEDFSIQRKLKARAGETGNVDQAARHEQEKDKTFIYKGYDDITCLVEADEEPPHPVNEEALTIALKVAKLLNMDVAGKIQFMRKTVVDGSNTSGFQRTALIGTDGYLNVDGKEIGIESLCLEEEACQVLERTEKKDIYNLSRLGIPLLEIATAPDISDPEECKAVAEKIGMILRSVDGMKRGIGSIRQDVNVSIEDGARTEIKGFQDYRNIPDVVENEVERQIQALEEGDGVEESVRKAEEDGTTTYLRPMPGADRMYPETDIEKITPDLEDIEVPETLEEKENRLQEEYDVSEQLAQQITRYESKGGDIETYMEKYGNDNLTDTNIAETIMVTVPNVEEEIGNVGFGEIRHDLFNAVRDGKISSNNIEKILEDKARNGEIDLSDYESISEEKIREVVRQKIEEDPDAPVGGLMGDVMQELRGKADGSEVMRILKEEKGSS